MAVTLTPLSFMTCTQNGPFTKKPVYLHTNQPKFKFTLTPRPVLSILMAPQIQMQVPLESYQQIEQLSLSPPWKTSKQVILYVLDLGQAGWEGTLVSEPVTPQSLPGEPRVTGPSETLEHPLTHELQDVDSTITSDSHYSNWPGIPFNLFDFQYSNIYATAQCN